MKTKGGTFIVLMQFCLGLFLFFTPQKLIALDKNVVINEVAWMGTTVSSNDEWIELRNLTDAEIDLNNWVLQAQDGSPEIKLTGKIVGNGFYLLERTDDDSAPNITANQIYTGALSNAGEILILQNADGVVIDTIENANPWPAGDNTTKQTMSRADNGTWQNSAVANGTPRTANDGGSVNPEVPVEPEICGNGKLESSEECDDGNNVDGDGCSSSCSKESLSANTATTSQDVVGSSKINYRWGQVLINELVSNPEDDESEWTEIYNTTGEDINLESWTIEDGSGAKTKLKGILGGTGDKKFLVVEKPVGNLNNAGDLIILKYNDGAIDSVAYGNWDDGNKDNNAPVARDPLSLARQSDGYNTFNNKNDFAVTTKKTKGASNIIIKSDEEDLDDGVSTENSGNIKISEILPNPAGDDNGEFIELYNKSNSDIDLTGWKIGDADENDFVFKDKVIKSFQFLVVSREETKIALNNDEDEVNLFLPQKEKPIQTIKYKNAPAGESYNDLSFTKENLSNSFVIKKLAWSKIATAGQANQVPSNKKIIQADFDAPAETEIGVPVLFNSSDTANYSTSSLEYFWEFGDGATSTLASPEHTFLKVGLFKVKMSVSNEVIAETITKNIKVVKSKIVVKGVDSEPQKSSTAVKKNTTKKTTIKVATKKVNTVSTTVELDKVKDYNQGAQIRTEGVVAVLPGVFGVQYFYIIGSGGAQVYNYKKEFPDLKLGDRIAVVGELSYINNEPRIKTKSKTDIKVIKQEAPPQPESLSCEGISEENLGHLVALTGEVTEKKGSTIFLDDGTDEAQVYLKKSTGLASGSFKEGEKVEVRGILSKSGTNLRLIPRGPEDIIKTVNAQTDVLGTTSPADEWQLAQRDRTEEFMKYGLVLAIFVIVVLGIVIFRMKKK